MRKIIFAIIVAILAYFVISGLFRFFQSKPAVIVDFATCAKAGRPIMESYPRQCQGPNGKNYLEAVTDQSLNTDPVILSPDLSRPVGSPLNLAGEARGFWFFEATFPVKLIDDKGNTVATGTARAKGEWMTADFVPFTATLTFKTPTAQSGVLILAKDNPSGLANQAGEIRLPVFFQKIGDTLNKDNNSPATVKKTGTATGTATTTQ